MNIKKFAVVVLVTLVLGWLMGRMGVPQILAIPIIIVMAVVAVAISDGGKVKQEQDEQGEESESLKMARESLQRLAKEEQNKQPAEND